jgi:hypothetical protein
MTKHLTLLLVAALSALCIASTAAAKTPPPAAVQNVGQKMIDFGQAVIDVGKADNCKTAACVHAAFAPVYSSAKAFDTALHKLWDAAGQSGACANSAATVGGLMDNTVKSFHVLEAYTVAHNTKAQTAEVNVVSKNIGNVTAAAKRITKVCL